MIVERTFWNSLKRKLLGSNNKVDPLISRPLSIGIVGAGNVVSWKYLPTLRHGNAFKVLGIFDKNLNAALHLSTQLQCPVYHSVDEILLNAQIDALFICTPPGTHFEIIRKALAQNIHVLCEKPLTQTLSEAVEIVNLAKASESIGMVNYSFRNNPEWVFVKWILKNQLLGSIHNVTGQLAQGMWYDAMYRPSKERQDAVDWRYHPGGGILHELGSHLIDLFIWLLGDIKSVDGSYAIFGKQEVPSEDIGNITLAFEGGAIAQLQVSRMATGYKEHCCIEIFGSQGAIRLDQGKVYLWLRDNPRWRQMMLPKTPSGNFLHTFYQAVNHLTNEYPTFEEGLKTQTVIETLLKRRLI